MNIFQENDYFHEVPASEPGGQDKAVTKGSGMATRSPIFRSQKTAPVRSADRGRAFSGNVSLLRERRRSERDRLRFGLALDRFQEHLRDVDDLDLLARAAVGLPRREAVVQHHLAERAAGGDLRRRGAER